jgi:hypothetical protein
MQLFSVDMDRADSLSGGAGHPERQVLDYIKTNIHITSSGMLPERLLRHTLDFTSVDRSPTIPATGPMPPRSGSSSRPSPPRGACQDRLRQRRGPILPGLVATAHPPTRRSGQNAKPGRLRAPVQRAYRTLRSAPNVSHAPHPPAATPNGGSRALRSLEATTQRDGRATFITLHRSAAGIRR